MLIIVDQPGAYATANYASSDLNQLASYQGIPDTDVTGVAQDENGNYTGEILRENPWPIDENSVGQWRLPFFSTAGGFDTAVATICPRNRSEWPGGDVSYSYEAYDANGENATAFDDPQELPEWPLGVLPASGPISLGWGQDPPIGYDHAGALNITTNVHNTLGVAYYMMTNGDGEASTSVPLAEGDVTVELWINDTAVNTDDYVVKKKPNTPATLLQVAKKGAADQKGAADNGMPMKIHLTGTKGAVYKVSLSVPDNPAKLEIKRADGTAYPQAGENVTVGTDLETIVYGSDPSNKLNAEHIVAKTGDKECCKASLTVIWIDLANMTFRGTNGHQNEQYDANNSGKGSNTTPQLLGLQFGPPNQNVKVNARLRQEIKIRITPDIVLPNVTWDILRQLSSRDWYGVGNVNPIDIGPLDWKMDTIPGGPLGGIQNQDMDAIQAENDTAIFREDAPGYDGLACLENWRYSTKNKFREWVEVKIGDKWYVCSPYLYWRMIMHLKYDNVNSTWIPDNQKVNEIVPETIDGFPATDNWQE